MENVSTISFYRIMALGASAVYGVVTVGLFWDNLTTGIIVSYLPTKSHYSISLPVLISFNSSILILLSFPFQFLNILVLSIYLGCYQMMRYISRPTYAENNQLIDPGLDLNMEGGMGE